MHAKPCADEVVDIAPSTSAASTAPDVADMASSARVGDLKDARHSVSCKEEEADESVDEHRLAEDAPANSNEVPDSLPERCQEPQDIKYGSFDWEGLDEAEEKRDSANQV